jgi:hypothetical protein
MQQADGEEPKSAPTSEAPALLDWSLQTLALRRLCAHRPKALELISLAALGYDDRELLEALRIDENAFDAEVDAIATEYEKLSRAFFAHQSLRTRRVDEIPDLAEKALEAFADSVDLADDVVEAGKRLSPRRTLEVLRAASFRELIERIAGDLSAPLAALGSLPRLLPKAAPHNTSPSHAKPNAADRGKGRST